MVKPCDIIVDNCDGPEKNPPVDDFIYDEWNSDSVIAYHKTAKRCIFVMKTKSQFWLVDSQYPNKRTGAGELVGYKSGENNKQIKLIQEKGIILKPKLFQQYLNRRFLELI
jgi:hypothetical protein